MIEAERMLHLRRYLTLVARTQLRTLQRDTATSRVHPPRRGGYVVGCVQHPRHASLRPEIYVATCNRMYSTTVLQSSRSDVVDHKLMSFCDDVKKGQVSADGLREIIDLCSKNDYPLPHGTGVLLLKCCGNLLPDLEAAERDHLAGQVWRLAKKNGGALTLEYYNTLLNINMENSKFVNPKMFLSGMNVVPDENTYRLLLNAAMKTDNSEYLWDILSIIKDKNVTICEETINALVQMYVANDNIVEVERMITLMQEAKLSTTKAYTELACRYATLGDIPNLVKILNEEPQSNVSLLRIIKALSMSKNSRHIPVILNFLMTSVSAIEPEISRMIAELVRADQVVDAHTIINCFAMNNVPKDIVQGFVNSFMNELVVSNASVNDIVKYANDFINSGYSQHVLTDVAEIGLKLGREKLCHAIFQAMRNRNIEIRPHYYWPLFLRAYHSNKGEAKIFSLVESMTNEGIEIDSDTLLDYVLPYVNTTNPIVTLQKLLLNNVPSTISCTSLLSFLLNHNRVQDITQLCNINCKVHYRELMNPLIHTYLITKDAKNCVMLLTAFPQGQDFVGLFLKSILRDENPIYIEDLQILLEEFKRRKVKISQEDGIILKDRLEKNKNFNITTKMANLIDDLVDPNRRNSARILHTRYMNTKELMYYLVELNSKKANTQNILRRLLMLYCFENNLKKAEEIKREYDTCKYEWTPSMKSFLFELYLKQDKLNEAEALLPDLQILPGEFQINQVKTVMYATALVKADKLTKAFDVIDTFNTIDKTDINRDAQAQCCTLLQTLAQSQHYDRTADMLNLLLTRNYCQITVELLRPLVAIPLIQHNDVLGAVNVLVTCARKYQKAPLTLEVMTVLLEQSNSELHNANEYIEQVYDIAVTAYSVNVANTLLAIALATLNKTEKLQVLLQNHKLSMNCLIYYINNIKIDSALDGMQNLFKVADKNHLDQNMISNTLLSVYSKMGDCNRALELWKIMCAKNIKSNDKFEKNFIQFLLSNKVPLPSNFDKVKVK